MSRAYVGLGSNLGDPAGNVERGFTELARLATIVRRSSLYRTAPWGKTDQPEFVNAVALLETDLTPRALLKALKDAEQRLGRENGERWGPRTIDLDLLTFGDSVIDEPGLRVPHPYLAARAFVLVPLAEIDSAYAPARDALAAEERAGVSTLSRPPTTL
ncbi:MAG: 2-amino-4-hydroxy-6-hydroxymethyldihydropteridine diphosphokinase [Candidatus Eremiobacteraeota bacterium]|nr:2-amino-4-hydroxy-6-hydroxymethyldihydropteridine diphosphokinase [Candidatus Eremiobacteraeota bacterium]MBV8283517.1 2-amino-4-hydroxy-6-hydroxymethyldihydropteridine diphosphokinase [Candidatus Eremiobacteraeota bacterium]MBV8333696.1 2-amino-4-hydroxy-6-hydroxymethyldihydropteridine diphosphokinase [Candidatus Eremiobacteraeota bacterium]MBV8433666.1 2-amino-4-hydroxy-6-hydroxymethyldihydropteridine diphosphokinase [Candidatus Eremiobacteraeota bacterium]MBV8655893.1 2-amino-4-hydroxy-6-